MREIEFRLIKDNKIVGYEKHTQNKGSFKSSIFHTTKNENEVGWELNNITALPHKIIDCDNKEQYIGLKDVSNTKIYEGDKFEIKGVVFYVAYNEDRVTYDLLTGNGYDSRNCLDLDCDIIYGKEIVGNIHEEKYI